MAVAMIRVAPRELCVLPTPTSLSLLERLRRQPDEPAWGRLHAIYLPLIQCWLARVPGLKDEASDLAQEVFLVVVRELPAFERQREGSFRAWLRRVTVNRARTFGKQRQRRPIAGLGDATDAFLDRLIDPASDLAREWDREHDRHVLQKLLDVVRPDFAANTWEAFRRFALEDQPAARVAAELAVSENAVLLAKSRVLKWLREEAAGLID